MQSSGPVAIGGSKLLKNGGRIGKALGVAGTLGGAVQIYEGVQDFGEGRTGEGVVNTTGGAANAVAAGAALAGMTGLAETAGPIGAGIDGAHEHLRGVPRWEW